MQRKILHFDLDAFFVSAELLAKPELKGQPVAIGGSVRGVISTCSYEARVFGVRSGMATKTALKLCPKLILLPHHFSLYRDLSDQFFEILYAYGFPIQSVSIDEAYMEIPAEVSGTLLGQEIRKKVRDLTGLNVSVGVATNKLLAKIACEKAKPNGLFCLPPDQVGDFMQDLPLKNIHGVGIKFNEVLLKHGWKTCGDLQKIDRWKLISLFGVWGNQLYEFCRGIDHRELVTEWERKSLSTEETFGSDSTDSEILKLKMVEIFEDLERRLKNHTDRKIKSLFVKIKYFDFTRTTVEEQGETIDFDRFWNLFLKRFAYQTKAVRLIGMGVRFISEEEDQLELPIAL